MNTRIRRITMVLAVSVACGVGTEASAQAVSRCDLNVRAGAAVPVSSLPNTFVESETGFGAGLSCGGTLRIGGTLELANVGLPRLWYFLGELRWLRVLGTGLLSPWLSIAGGPGLFVNRASEDVAPVEPPGQRARIPSDGFAMGSSVRLGYPAVGRWSLFLDVALRVAFVPTECSFDCDPAEEGPNTLWTLPVTVGFRVGL